MSTEENKELARRIIEEIWNKGNMAVADELTDSNYVLHTSTSGVVFKGLEDFKKYITMLHASFPDALNTIDDIIAEGDKVALRITMGGTFKGTFMGIAPTGKQFTLPGMIIIRFEGGKQVEMWNASNVLEMLQQLGVIPPVGQVK